MKKITKKILIIILLPLIIGIGILCYNISQKHIDNNEIKITESNIPNISADNANLILSGDTLLIQTINSGLSSFSSTIMSYSLKKDKLIKTLDLGEGLNFIEPKSSDEFYVINYNDKTITTYTSKMEKKKTDTLTNIEREPAFVKVSNDKKHLIYSDIKDGSAYIKNLDNNQEIKVNYQIGIYSYLGNYNDLFIVLDSNNAICSVDTHGNVKKLYLNITPQSIGDGYATLINDKYINFISLTDGKRMILDVSEESEIFYPSNSKYLFSHIIGNNDNDSFGLYNLKDKIVNKINANGKIVSSVVTEDGDIIALIRKDNKILCHVYRANEGNKTSLNIKNIKDIIMNDKLSDYTGSEETIEKLKQFQKDYGVKVIYSGNFFDVSDYGYKKVKGTDEETAISKLNLLKEVLDILPEGTTFEIGKDKPLIVYLCNSIENNIDGLNTVIDGYNVIYISVRGKDEYFTHTFAHELGHALERNVSSKIIEGWANLMPEEVRKVYDKLDLTVEYTKDDKGRTPVWFIDVYGRSNEMEDRATVFADIYNNIKNNKSFEYDGLKQKSEYWKTILKNTYNSCMNADFKW